jgi:hypothetical protein
MKFKIPMFDVGLEIEFFLTQNSTVFNASKEMKDRLGFSIDQNEAGSGRLVLGNGFVLRTDNTAAELQWYLDHNQGALPSQEMIWDRINELPVLNGFCKIFRPILHEGDKGLTDRPTIFKDAGERHADDVKKIHNAYTGESRYQDKKEGGVVTYRTAGLHLHFSPSAYFSDADAARLNSLIFNPSQKEDGTTCASALVQLLDRIYTGMFVDHRQFGCMFGNDNNERVKKYQKLGDYRIKHFHQSGKQTLEYRQLDSSMCIKRVQELINIFQFEACQWANSNQP